MTQPNLPLLKKCNDLLNALETPLERAYCRWMDEREYEDINDYVGFFKTVPDCNIIKMTKHPFGIVLEVDGTQVQFFITAKEYGYKSYKQKKGASNA